MAMRATHPIRSLDALMREQDGVFARWQVSSLLTDDEIVAKLRARRWQRPARSVYVTHNGPLSHQQMLWTAVLSCGRLALLGGVAAAQLDGFTMPRNLRAPAIDVLLPSGREAAGAAPGVRVRRSAHLGPEHVHPTGGPPRTRLPRSILDAASWAPTVDQGRAILVSSIQQRLARPADLHRRLEALPRQVRRSRWLPVLQDAELGIHAPGELDFAVICRRFGLPEPSRQVIRRDARGRARWLDVYFDDYGLVIEIDGLWHMEAFAWWDDLDRANQHVIDGEGLLRFPTFVVRERPEEVAATVAAALRRRGWTG